MALRGKTAEEQIFNFLIGKGMTPAGAAGLMGNLYAESGLKPTNLENTYERALAFPMKRIRRRWIPARMPIS